MKKSLPNHNGKKLLALTAALLATFSLSAWSGNEDTELDTIVVSATRSEQNSVITPVAITTINHDQIEKSGANNVIDILRTQPGIQIQDSIGDGSHSIIGMRGFSATAQNNVLIMIDGRKLNNPTLEAPALSSISMKDIERIEIIQGSAGVLYGDQAVAGVINIITRGSSKRLFHLEASRGTDDLETYSGTASQAFASGIAYRVSAENKNADNYRDNNEASYKNYSGRLEYNNEKTGVFAEQEMVNDNLHLPGSLTATQADQDRRQTTHPLDFSNSNINTSRIGGNIWLTKNLQFLAELTNRDIDANGLIGISVLSHTDFQSFNPRLAGTFDSPYGTANFTVGVDRDESSYQSIWGGFPSSDFSQEQNSVYGQLTYPVAQNTFVTAGTRETTVHNDDAALGKKQNDTEHASELGVSYYGIKNTRLFTRAADTFRFANADENAFTLAGISFLKPQTSRSIEAGAEYTASAFNVLAQIYDMSLDNEIIYDAFASPNIYAGTGANVNLNSSHRKGMLFQGGYNATESLRLTANYTYTNAELDSGTFVGNTVPFVAKHTSSVAATYQINSAWSAYIDATYVGSQYRLGDEANTAPKIAPYWLCNTSLKWKPNNFFTQLRINNLTGTEYPASIYSSGAQYPAATRTAILVVGYDF